ncbi:late competence development ComFB family protein [Pectinatus sottacetonis]|uniref:late competence development ComFB family protein n=1 Tax=Pectinatus sottacetonis TaxID=1002795 RepID=UPI0018C82017|nr:late competence development ComFB family protein [Pectinatus sottacetonis]
MNIHVKNCMESFVIEMIEKMIKSYPNACKCDQCLNDMAALALNHLPPKYVGTDIGDTYTRLDIYNKDQYAEIMQVVAQAIEIVSKNPHHNTTSKEKKLE